MSQATVFGRVSAATLLEEAAGNGALRLTLGFWSRRFYMVRVLIVSPRPLELYILAPWHFLANENSNSACWHY
jgi:hypothetical protein